MKWPWVSRETYQRVVDDLKRSETERKELLDRLLVQSGVAPLQQLAEALPAPGTAEAEAMVDPRTGELKADALPVLNLNSPSGMKRFVQAEMNKRAGRLG